LIYILICVNKNDKDKKIEQMFMNMHKDGLYIIHNAYYIIEIDD